MERIKKEWLSAFFEMIDDGVGKRAVCRASCGVDELARRFIDDKEIVVFIEDCERKIFGGEIAFSGSELSNLDDVACAKRRLQEGGATVF